MYFWFLLCWCCAACSLATFRPLCKYALAHFWARCQLLSFHSTDFLFVMDVLIHFGSLIVYAGSFTFVCHGIRNILSFLPLLGLILVSCSLCIRLLTSQRSPRSLCAHFIGCTEQCLDCCVNTCLCTLVGQQMFPCCPPTSST